MNYDIWQNEYPTHVTHRKHFDFISNVPCFMGRVSHRRCGGKLLSDVRRFYCRTIKLVL